MKRLILVATLAAFVLSGCGMPLSTRLPDGSSKTYPTYGILNSDDSKSKNVCYKLSIGNLILSILFVETIIIPVYLVGFDIMNPVRLKKSPTDECGGIDG